jgi:hypothetical protein
MAAIYEAGCNARLGLANGHRNRHNAAAYRRGSRPSLKRRLRPTPDRVADLAEGDYDSRMTGSTGGSPLKVAVLLAIVLILTFATSALGGPRQGPAWQPCDYNTDWKIDGTNCG